MIIFFCAETWRECPQRAECPSEIYARAWTTYRPTDKGTGESKSASGTIQISYIRGSQGMCYI